MRWSALDMNLTITDSNSPKRGARCGAHRKKIKNQKWIVIDISHWIRLKNINEKVIWTEMIGGCRHGCKIMSSENVYSLLYPCQIITSVSPRELEYTTESNTSLDYKNQKHELN